MSVTGNRTGLRPVDRPRTGAVHLDLRGSTTIARACRDRAGPLAACSERTYRRLRER